MKEAWYNKKWAVVLLHASAWITLFSLPYLLRPSYNVNQQTPKLPVDDTLNFILARINDLFLVSFFYLNALVLFPRLLYKKQFLFYILAVIGCFGLIALQSGLLRKSFPQAGMHFELRKHLFFSFFIFIFILACSIAYRTIRDKIVTDNIAKEKENEFLKTELSLLRSQVSPHFMFNVLNNMVALARKQSDQLEPSLIKLSSLMRYMLYETDEEKVTLEKETEYLQSYIDLQQQRFGKKVVINTIFKQPDEPYFIEPMLLIPFVENAFKHGTGMIENAMINIELSAVNNQLIFAVQNKYNRDSSEIKDKASGIGLTNVARRLDLLYKNKHELMIEKDNSLFTVKLEINLA
ncbi:MAG: histidine kinase [Chitinophagaceae bacterium]|nr:histidine kinase [Chitinophagaceae bacterium]